MRPIASALLLLMISINASGAVKDPVYDDFEGLELVEVLIRDSRFQLAESELKSLPNSTRKTLLSGNLEYARQNYPAAEGHYKKLPVSPENRLVLARTYAQLKNWPSCHENFSATGRLWLNSENDLILKATCEFHINLWERSLASLSEGFKKFKSFAVQREKVSLLIQMSLTQAALDTALARANATTSAQILALAELFHEKKLGDETLILLEWSRTRFPFDLDTNLSLAKAYFSRGQLRATAEAFERAARVDRKFAYHAAELRRQLGDVQAANFWLMQIEDPKEQIRSRLALYVDSGWYSMIASMESLVSSGKFSHDDEVRYALGYSLLRQGNLVQPLKYLTQITSPHHAERAALLRKTIVDCRANSGTCRL